MKPATKERIERAEVDYHTALPESQVRQYPNYEAERRVP